MAANGSKSQQLATVPRHEGGATHPFCRKWLFSPPSEKTWSSVWPVHQRYTLDSPDGLSCKRGKHLKSINDDSWKALQGFPASRVPTDTWALQSLESPGLDHTQLVKHLSSVSARGNGQYETKSLPDVSRQLNGHLVSAALFCRESCRDHNHNLLEAMAKAARLCRCTS